MKSSTYHVLHSNLSPKLKINHRYMGVTYNKKAVAIMDQQYMTYQHQNGQFCRKKCTIPTPHEPSALCAKNNQEIGEQCSLSISHAPHTFIPVAVTSNLWIIPSNPKTLGSTITIICSDKATSTVPL